VTRPPVSWTEIAGLIPKMTKVDQSANILNSTVALGEFRNVVNAKDILSALFIQSGTPIVSLSSDGVFQSTLKDNYGLGTSPAVLALQFYSDFSNPSRPQYSWNRSLANSLDTFANGDLAMYFGFASEFTLIKTKNPNLNFSTALLPQIAGAKVNSTFGYMLGMSIMRSSTNPSGAYTVINALTSAEAFPFWSSIFNLPSARRDILSQPETNATKSVFNQSAIISKGWYDPNALSTGAIFQNMVESYTTGRESIDSVISTASARLDSLLK
jgi:ABC-type glycerol-3-phosphate transport system substrate-binding protein